MKEFAKNTWDLILIYALIVAAIVWLNGCGGVRLTPTMTVAAAHELARQAEEKDAYSFLLWVAGISILGLGGCVVASILLPLKKIWAALAAGFGATLAISLTTRAALPYLPWVALGVGLVAVGVAIWYFRKYVLATHAAVLFGTSMTSAETDAQAAALKAQHAAFQQQIGVKGIIDAMLNQPQSPPATSPPV
jgi:hypothetical protein